MQINVSKKPWLGAIFYLVLLVALGGWLYQQNQPQNLATPAWGGSEKLQCVSYSPYHRDNQSPFVVGMWINHAQIDADLKALSALTNCVRTYSVGQGMDYVPEAAAKLGLKVYLGAWIGWVKADNLAEVNLAAQLANAYPDTVKALIIGNEVFLRKEQPESAMRQYIKLARSQTSTPITYADVWEFWIKHKAMAQSVDFITVHILPYWENDPVAIGSAVSHAENVMAQLTTIFKKPILIGETGWPSLGRQREASKPSLVNQARYVREFLQKAHEKNWQYNIIEAIDQPWKRVLEGTVGGYWGVMGTDFSPKFSLIAPVAERHDGKMLLWLALIGALLGGALTLLQAEKRLSLIIGLSALGALSALTALMQYEYLTAVCRDWIEWFALGGLALVGWMAILIQPWHWVFPTEKTAQQIQLVRYCLLYAAIITSSIIAIDGRYRDYPISLFILPVLVISMGAWFSVRIGASSWRSHRWLCIFSVWMAILCLVLEYAGIDSMIWLALCVLLSFANWSRSTQRTHSI